MAKKRRREQPAVDIKLVEIYEDLANVDENIRLKAAHSLLTNFSAEGKATGDQLNEILRRLIRGLCSGRKAARLGFSIALTEFLTELLGPKGSNIVGFQSISELIETLKKQTYVSGNVSGQEERDHQFGRLFGAESIIKSQILFHPGAGIEVWDQILDVVYELATKKPWLREECGFILFNSIQALRDQDSKYAQLLMGKLHVNGLSKTPEGVAVWIVAKAEFPILDFPSGVWSHDNPLYQKNISALAEVLKTGAEVDLAQNGTEANPARKGTWSTKVHFVWDVILATLLHDHPAGLRMKQKKGKTMSFADFWEGCFDNTLFAAASSEERKYWGFLLFQRTIHELPVELIPSLFSQNFMRCLTNQLVSPDRFLNRAAHKTTKSILTRAKSKPDDREPILRAILTHPHGGVNFDKTTKSGMLESLLSNIDSSDYDRILALYEELIIRPGIHEEKDAASRRVIAADQLVSALRNVQVEGSHVNPTSDQAVVLRSLLSLLARCAYFDFENLAGDGKPSPPISQSSRQIFRTRISSCLAHIAAKPVDPAFFAYTLIDDIDNCERNHKFGKSLLEASGPVLQVISKAKEILVKAKSTANEDLHNSPNANYLHSIALLYSLTILQVYNEDAEAVNILEELNDYFEGLLHNKRFEKGSATLVEVLLSFASKPSQLFRRLAQQVFTACASDVDETGLQSMMKILETKESASGQAEMFDQDNDVDDSQDASDVEEIEMAEAGSNNSSGGDESDDDDPDGSSHSADDSDGLDDELRAFDAKLAQTLGTRPGKQDLDAEDSSSSDEDMDDEQMEALDEHLEKVFRERKKLTSKKTEKKDAKEMIINFKCRVLELSEIYVKQQHTANLALSLLLPVLTVIRTTTSPLVSNKACKLIREYSRLCKGDDLPQVEDTDVIFDLLEEVHLEAGKEASNAHTSACSQASLLFVRILVAHDKECLRRVVRIYGSTQEKALFDSGCKVKTSFFTDWLNWCTSARK